MPNYDPWRGTAGSAPYEGKKSLKEQLVDSDKREIAESSKSVEEKAEKPAETKAEKPVANTAKTSKVEG